MSASRADGFRRGAWLCASILIFGAAMGAEARDPYGTTVGSDDTGPLILGPIGRPPPPDRVEREPLPPLDPAAVGVVPPYRDSGEETGRTSVQDLGPDLWAGSRRSDIVRLIQALPPRIDNPTLNGLIRRALLAPAAPPEGPKTTADLPVLRVAALATLGDLEGAAALAEAIPEAERGSDLARIEADIYLLRFDLDAACLRAEDAIARDTDPYWQKLMVFCRIRADRKDEAALIADLLRDRGHDDPAFFALADTLLGLDKARVATLPAASPLHMAMLRAAGLPVPSDTAADAKPALLRTIALSPNADLPMRLTAAEQAVAANALDSAVLAKLYLEARGGSAPRTRPGSDGLAADSVLERASLFEAARTATEPAQRAAAAKHLLEAARVHGVLRPVAAIAMPLLSDLKPVARLSFFAAEAARAALAVGDTATAAQWFELAKREAPGNPQAANAAAVTWPLLMLADPDTEWSDGLFRRWWELQLEADAGRAAQRASIFLAVLDALDTAVPQQAWTLIPTPAPERGSVDPALRELTAAAERKRRGETLLRVAETIVQTPTIENGGLLRPAQLHAAVRALRAAGFRDEARRMAVDAAIGAGV